MTPRVRTLLAALAVSVGLAAPALAADLATPTAVAGTPTPAASPDTKEPLAQIVCRASCNFNPASLATDTFTVHECPCAGAEIGQLAVASLITYDVTDYTQIAIHGARVIKANWVRFTVQNTGGDTVDPGPLTIQYAVFR